MSSYHNTGGAHVLSCCIRFKYRLSMEVGVFHSTTGGSLGDRQGHTLSEVDPSASMIDERRPHLGFERVSQRNELTLRQLIRRLRIDCCSLLQVPPTLHPPLSSF